MASHTISLRFYLSYNDLDPEEVTRSTGLQPSISSRAGIIPAGGTRPARHTIWSFEAPVTSTDSSIERQWEAMAPLLVPHVALFKGAPLGSARMVIVVEALESYPSLVFPLDLMKFLVEIGAELEVDSYVNDAFVLKMYATIQSQ